MATASRNVIAKRCMAFKDRSCRWLLCPDQRSPNKTQTCWVSLARRIACRQQNDEPGERCQPPRLQRFFSRFLTARPIRGIKRICQTLPCLLSTTLETEAFLAAFRKVVRLLK